MEWIAAALGLANIVLLVRRSIWNYPFGIAMVSLYFFVFRDAKLYSDAGLQVFFLVIQIYGWWNWSRARRDTDALPVTTMSDAGRISWLIGTAVAALGWGWLMARYTDAAAPLVDAAIAAASIAAQLLLALRCVENWVLWIAADVTAIGLFLSRGLHATAALYALFLVLAIAGLRAWAAAYRAQHPA